MKEPFQVFKALADETRLRILSLLSHGEMCVSDLDAVLMVGQSKVSRHLDYLRKTALVTSRRTGTLVFYRLDLDHQTMEKRVLELWKEWGESTATGRRDWENFQSLTKRLPPKES
ncbi:MAG TPA: metalloregulator ArsR/SmtB family transcription factor [Spirochaetia bacterium]|nr:metalloregulator ArsR/SmtB family transcription factor [Spirochaetia bacterium]